MAETWNVRRLSDRKTNRRRFRSLIERVWNEKWEMVPFTEYWVDEDGVVWLGEDDERPVLIHCKKVDLPMVTSNLSCKSGNTQGNSSGQCRDYQGPLHCPDERTTGRYTPGDERGQEAGEMENIRARRERMHRKRRECRLARNEGREIGMGDWVG